ncbi:hypothetical protein TNCV_176191 [Trichonephila clavipes]|nr:hypothetical protein TNCV_176191 [Trichonephila clavipes]
MEEALNGFGGKMTQQVSPQDTDASSVSTLGKCYAVLGSRTRQKGHQVDKWVTKNDANLVLSPRVRQVFIEARL